MNKFNFSCPTKVYFGEGAARQALADFIRVCGLPTQMGDLKSKVEITPEILRQAAESSNSIKSGSRELDRNEIYEILMECL